MERKMRNNAILFTLFLCLFALSAAFADEEQQTIEFYESYVQTSLKAKSLSELKPYLSQKNISQMGEISKEDEASFLEIMREVRSTFKIKEITSKIEGNTAILTVDGTDADDPNTKVKGIITLVKENGEWKLDNEDYTSETTIE